LEKLRQKKAELETQIALLRQRAAEAAKKDDGRRKLLIGAAVMAACESGAIQAEVVVKVLDRFLYRPADRDAFTSGRFQLPAQSGS
jgi:septal ring factor EnvC (AmiA/AmiB activator)